MSLGNKIYTLRKSKNLSQNELAELLNVSRQAVSKWETDAAVPELDKLIALGDLFEISLDDLTERNVKQKTDSETIGTSCTAAFTPQKIIGYILLAVSLIGLLLSILLSRDTDIQYILVSAMLSLTVCSLICLFVGRRAGYWCVWSLMAPLFLLSSCTVAFPIWGAGLIAQGIFVLMILVVANKQFCDTSVKVTRARSIGILIGWGCFILVRSMRLTLLVYSMGIFGNSGAAFSPIFRTAFELLSYGFIAVFLTYTVCYIKTLKKNFS
jgi:transcriptional regulator with XRE-family HTH domain